MTPREKRGVAIARKGGLVQKTRDLWIVPSQSHEGSWVVDWTAGKLSCTCPDFSTRAEFCKHIFASLYYSGRIEMPKPKITYSQNWSAYNAAKKNEGRHFRDLLSALCHGIHMKPQSGSGRPKAALGDVVFGCVYKAYTGHSGRRVTSDLKKLADEGFLSRAPSYNTISLYMRCHDLTPLLRTLVHETSAPLASVEKVIAIDSSGFSTRVYDCYFESRHGRHNRKAQYLTAHAAFGVDTQIVTDLLVNNEGDATQFRELLSQTTHRFNLDEVLADKAYSSKANLAHADALGITPYIPFREGTGTGKGPQIWKTMFHYYKYKEAEFKTHYHQRSNAETGFSMVKRNQGGSLLSKTYVAQVNEVYCKFLVHNICVLIASIYELGIQPEFWQEAA